MINECSIVFLRDTPVQVRITLELIQLYHRRNLHHDSRWVVHGLQLIFFSYIWVAQELQLGFSQLQTDCIWVATQFFSITHGLHMSCNSNISSNMWINVSWNSVFNSYTFLLKTIGLTIGFPRISIKETKLSLCIQTLAIKEKKEIASNKIWPLDHPNTSKRKTLSHKPDLQEITNAKYATVNYCQATEDKWRYLSEN
jgi:hypothetical protein